MTRIPIQNDPRLASGSVQNIVDAYNGATTYQRLNGANWYVTARTAALAIHPNGPAIVAALSPAIAWDINLIAARELVTTGDTKWQSWANKKKALRVMAGEEPLDVLGGNKVRAFYAAIADLDGSPVIDRHALSVYMGQRTSDKQNKVLERVGAYELVADAYRKAAELMGLAVHIIQAVTWVTWRENMPMAYS